MAIRGLIFDLDGVLVNTVPAHFSAWSRMFEEYGYAFGKKEYRELVDGRPRMDGANAVMHGAPDGVIREAAEKKNDYFIDLIEAGKFEVFESAVRFVNLCVGQGYRMATASSSTNVHSILEICGLVDMFDIIIGGDEVVHGKPNPEIFLNAARGIGVPVNECVVFEDSEYGVIAAKAGGFYCIGLGHGDDVGDLSLADQVVLSLEDVDLKQVDSAMEHKQELIVSAAMKHLKSADSTEGH